MFVVLRWIEPIVPQRVYLPKLLAEQHVMKIDLSFGIVLQILEQILRF